MNDAPKAAPPVKVKTHKHFRIEKSILRIDAFRSFNYSKGSRRDKKRIRFLKIFPTPADSTLTIWPAALHLPWPPPPGRRQRVGKGSVTPSRRRTPSQRRTVIGSEPMRWPSRKPCRSRQRKLKSSVSELVFTISEKSPSPRTS